MQLLKGGHTTEEPNNDLFKYHILSRNEVSIWLCWMAPVKSPTQILQQDTRGYYFRRFALRIHMGEIGGIKSESWLLIG